MLTSTTLPQTTRNIGGTLYALILDAHGKPLALAPLQQLHHTPFPPEQIQLVDAEAHVLATPNDATNSLNVKSQVAPNSNAAFVRDVESALKRMYDLAYLCEHPLAQLPIVTARLAQRESPNCLDRARLLRTLLQETIEQLRPHGATPSNTAIPRREWHPYLILHRAYIEGEPNYRIMNWLQISEGTFNRTRRQALRGVANALSETQAQVLPALTMSELAEIGI